MRSSRTHVLCVTFFFNDTATTEIYTLSLHDALPIYRVRYPSCTFLIMFVAVYLLRLSCFSIFEYIFCTILHRDRKSTRLNSSHANISYAVFCLKKKKRRE